MEVHLEPIRDSVFEAGRNQKMIRRSLFKISPSGLGPVYTRTLVGKNDKIFNGSAFRLDGDGVFGA